MISFSLISKLSNIFCRNSNGINRQVKESLTVNRQVVINLSEKMAATPLAQIKGTLPHTFEKARGYAGFFEYLGIAFDSLRANKLRSFLTLLGIIIGITSIISVISIIEGLNQYWQ